MLGSLFHKPKESLPLLPWSARHPMLRPLHVWFWGWDRWEPHFAANYRGFAIRQLSRKTSSGGIAVWFVPLVLPNGFSLVCQCRASIRETVASKTGETWDVSGLFTSLLQFMSRAGGAGPAGSVLVQDWSLLGVFFAFSAGIFHHPQPPRPHNIAKRRCVRSGSGVVSRYVLGVVSYLLSPLSRFLVLLSLRPYHIFIPSSFYHSLSPHPFYLSPHHQHRHLLRALTPISFK